MAASGDILSILLFEQERNGVTYVTGDPLSAFNKEMPVPGEVWKYSLRPETGFQLETDG